ncbi:SUMF1/EgtB/PvdO family nonheme iron enzyme [Alkalisalibacterium limincola]|uniref:SUMF1/EgtB/PvdO family nonheme iron enzyme n=1 Tax=Alkalisalibacterium limincola TaxID=2699169 RepID=A0A5C8KVL2_9GAMM|nr:SUMF1/EgtB/PvdO family nonheme iron enzyme [Alkalisalibacterium limincola]TXK64350.1 SUMF1/EgtB/PvdO family nonheme iron enzyme [Alkalisalibacterium limincola]
MAYRFGPFQLDPRTGTLTGPEGPIPLRRQAFRLAEVLLEHAPELLDHHTLLDQAWGRTAISANALPQTISELRHALGDDAHAPRYIETVHRRGYRMACPVQRVDPGEDGAAPGEPTPDRSHPATPGSFFRAGAMLLAVALVVASTPSPPLGADPSWQRLHLDTLPGIRAQSQEDVFSAFRLVHEARGTWHDDPALEQVWLDLTLPVDITSEPVGAEVSVRAYGGGDDDWLALGHTPLHGMRLPLTMFRLRARLPGHADLELAPSVLPIPETLHLHRSEEIPEGMVYVPPGQVRYLDVDRSLPGFWIGRHEVTNREFKSFVDAGGYSRPEFWSEALAAHPGAAFEEVVADFVDATGAPGPMRWANGHWPQDEADHPVEGISWYEASAFAAFSGAALPNVFQWSRAAGLGTAQAANFSDILVASNFNGRGTTPVGASGGLGPYGTLDMAGNVWEWCANAVDQRRHLLGGSWMDNPYQFSSPNAMPPHERRPGFGMRLVHNEAPVDPADGADIAHVQNELPEPVDDRTFALLSRLFDYDETPLEARLESVEHHDAWRRERVSFDAAYGGERVLVDVLIPYRSQPPYQSVVHFPGGDALMLDSIDDAGLLHVEPFLRSARVVVYPVYKGTFHRRGNPPSGPIASRDLLIQQVKDLRRTLDYLHTRDDIDTQRIAFHGLSYGGWRAPYVLAVEERFATAMLISAGIPARALAEEIQPQDYLPRVKVPVLMLNGREDFTFPLERSQRPFFERLGTPSAHKRHVALDWGHLPPGYLQVSRELVAWADTWLGPVADGLVARNPTADPQHD